MSNLTPLEALRLNMKQNGVDAVVIPQTDPHHGEYIADHWQLRRHISGFTGSAGTLVVTAGDAVSGPTRDISSRPPTSSGIAPCSS